MNQFDRLSRASRVALLTGLCLLALVIVALISEGAVRIRQSLRHGAAIRIENLYHVDPESGLRVPVAGFSSEKININSFGFRGPEIIAKKPVGTVRIAFLGASTTFCAEVSNDRVVWPHLVIEKLRKRYPGRRFDYINGGVPGYTLASSLENLDVRVAPLTPDMIVIYHATNDLSADGAELARKRGISTPRGDKGLSWLAEYSMLWYLVEKNLVILKRQAKAHSVEGKLNVESSLLSEPFKARLTKVVVAAKKLAPETVLVTFSTRLRQKQSPEEKKESAVTSLYYMPYFTPDDLLRHFAAYNAAIRKVANETGVILIEGESEIPGDDQHFVDSVHFTDLGSEMMSRRVFDGLVSADLF